MIIVDKSNTSVVIIWLEILIRIHFQQKCSHINPQLLALEQGLDLVENLNRIVIWQERLYSSMTGVVDATMDAHKQAGDEVEGKEVLESVHLSDIAFSQFCHVIVRSYYFMVESG